MTIATDDTKSIILCLSSNLFSRYLGSVIELFALIVYLLSLPETIAQLSIVPISRPTAIHICPVPNVNSARQTHEHPA